MSANHLFPSSLLILRYICRLLDVKGSDSCLDELISQDITQPEKTLQLTEKKILDEFSKRSDPHTAKLIFGLSMKLITDVNRCASICNASGLCKQQVSRVINEVVVVPSVFQVLRKFSSLPIGFPSIETLASTSCNPVDCTLEWLSDNHPSWRTFFQGLEKTQKDRMMTWKHGKHIPSSQQLQLLIQQVRQDSNFQNSWIGVSMWLWVSRAIQQAKEDLRKLSWDTLEQEIVTSESIDFVAELSFRFDELREKSNQDKVFYKLLKIEEQLSPQNPKTENWQSAFSELSSIIQEAGAKTLDNFQYLVKWLEARKALYSSNQNEALELYQQAFYSSLYQAGSHQKAIIEESLVVASAEQRPNKVFLKKLKWAQITFHYDIPSVARGDKSSSNFSDTVESWEIEMWSQGFKKVFPHVGLSTPKNMTNSAQIEMQSTKSTISPDYKKPDKKIRRTPNGKTKVPQIVWFIEIGQYEEVERLVSAGANLNVTTESGETPLLKALQHLDPLASTRNPEAIITNSEIREFLFGSSKSLPRDTRYFDLLTTAQYKPETLNQSTQAERLSPLILAVESGIPRIVSKLLDMGASVDARGKTDLLTPLHYCLKCIAYLKNPKKYWEDQDAMSTNDFLLDSIRRQTMGKHGISLTDQKEGIARADDECIKLVKKLFNKCWNSYWQLSEMREIARLLLNAGADPNAEQNNPIKGHTPLMLAAQNDERVLFELMLIKGGDPTKTYFDNRRKIHASCKNIAECFQSTEILRVLEDIAPNFT